MTEQRLNILNRCPSISAQLGGRVAQDVRRDALDSGLDSIPTQVRVEAVGADREEWFTPLHRFESLVPRHQGPLDRAKCRGGQLTAPGMPPFVRTV